ncbi:hypothetical protein TNIN_381351 [Trichonephila inaurata madagascariensis]|uniref:Uncharacterized protein n=1 Tax=Trichonephila inaurata madagascariensis TaxID=2747483 RepID=A0A8X7CH83_9ARAC|nr:hypothetical protein TNIN_381351 [Trichonephila inaurata madagascariensis]
MPNEKIRSDVVRRIWSLSTRSFFHFHTGHERSKVDAILATLPLQATQTSSLGIAMFDAPVSQRGSIIVNVVCDHRLFLKPGTSHRYFES